MRVIVCGAGQVGCTIARHLAHEGVDVTVVDSSADAARKVDESYDVRGIVGHASHPDVLERAGAHGADMLVAVTRSDEVNMLACQVAQSLFGVGRRIARVRHHGYLGPIRDGLYTGEDPPISVVISPEVEVARGISRRLRAPGAFDMATLVGGKVQLLGIHCLDPACVVAGQALRDLPRLGVELSVVAIVRDGRAFIPHGRDRVERGDDVYVVARPDDVAAVMTALGHREQTARRVVLVGGGNVGLHLARILAEESPQVSLKLVEHSRARADEVARQLGPGVVVLHGDALDKETLDEANVGAAETVVAVTNDDETNIFASVLAKRAGCQRAITLVNKPSYEPLLPSLGIDAVVSPSAVTISTILRHMRRGKIDALHTLREDFGEVIEAEALPDCRLVGRPLSEAGLPDGMLVGAVVRGEDVIIPNDETRVEAGDHIVAVVTYAAVKGAEAILAGGAETRRVWPWR